jgi:DNA-binding beta-propeller fold protein YncE
MEVFMSLAHNRSRSRAVASLAPPAAGLLFLLSTGSAPASDLVSPLFAVWGFRAGTSFNQPRGIAFDTARGEIVMADTGAGTIDIFTVGGRPLERFRIQSRKPDGVSVPGIPRCVAVAQDGRYLVVDNTVDGVALVDRQGHSAGRLDLPATVHGSASALCVLPSGEVLVGGPPKDDRIYRFDPKGTLVGTWGVHGVAPGELYGITAIAALPQGDVVVACANTELSVQIFSPEGTYRRGFGIHDIGPGNFSLPSGIAVTPDGRIWVTDEIRMSLQVFDQAGTYLGVSGGMGTHLGAFLYPSALAGDGGRLLAVTDREAGRFQVLQINYEGGEVSEPKSEDGISARDRVESPRAALGSTQKGDTP